MIICYEFFGKINHSFKTTMGEEYAKIFNTLGKKEMGALESYIKSGGADAVGKRVLESVMEKVSKATPHLSTERSTSARTTIFPQRRNRHKICQKYHHRRRLQSPWNVQRQTHHLCEKSFQKYHWSRGFSCIFWYRSWKTKKIVSWGWCKNAKIWLQKLMQKNGWQIHSLTSWQDEKHKLA